MAVIRLLQLADIGDGVCPLTSLTASSHEQKFEQSPVHRVLEGDVLIAYAGSTWYAPCIAPQASATMQSLQSTLQ